MIQRAEALASQDRAHRDTVQAALASLTTEKDSALQAAVDAERRRADEAEARAASSAARAAEAEAARCAPIHFVGSVCMQLRGFFVFFQVAAVR